MTALGINIDHIATLRNARGDFFPSLAYAANIAETNGGDFITMHLREDRRHMKDSDLFLLKETVTTYLNLEMACNEEVLQQALKAHPQKVTLVPEKREEVTTEGGLNIRSAEQFMKVKMYTAKLKEQGIKVSLFLEPDRSILENCLQIQPDDIEIHTGRYSLNAADETLWKEIQQFAKEASEAGLKVCAGHGLTYHNTQKIASIPEIQELNIGYSIIVRALFVGLDKAVREMKRLIETTNATQSVVLPN